MRPRGSAPSLPGSASGCKAIAYSEWIAAAVTGRPQRGIIQSVYDAAANVFFSDGSGLSLNAHSAPCMPNGLQLSAEAGAYPFSELRAGMQVLLGAQCLHIEALDCSLDLSLCTRWDPRIRHPEKLDMERVRHNAEHLATIVANAATVKQGHTLLNIGDTGTWRQAMAQEAPEDMARFLCGRGRGLTPTGDDMLAGWMAVGWLLYGPDPTFLADCQHIVAIAERQTHLLSQCWLRCAAVGCVALPIVSLLQALTQADARQLERATAAVLALGATSGLDLIQGILLGFTQH